MNTVLDNLSLTGPAVVLFVPEGKDTILIGCDYGFREQTKVQLRLVMRYGGASHTEHPLPTWATPSKWQLPPGTTHVSIAREDTGSVPVTVTWL